MAKNKPLSAYEIVNQHQVVATHVLSVIVDNEPGVLARVIGLFSGRGYNIDSLTVSAVSRDDNTSRITVVTNGTANIINQIKAQLSRLIPVHEVHDLTTDGAFIAKEVALIKLIAIGEKRAESLRYADIFKSTITDTTRDSLIFQLAGSPEKITAFIDLIAELGDIEIARSGVVAMARGNGIIHA